MGTLILGNLHMTMMNSGLPGQGMAFREQGAPECHGSSHQSAYAYHQRLAFWGFWCLISKADFGSRACGKMSGFGFQAGSRFWILKLSETGEAGELHKILAREVQQLQP